MDPMGLQTGFFEPCLLTLSPFPNRCDGFVGMFCTFRGLLGPLKWTLPLGGTPHDTFLLSCGGEEGEGQGSQAEGLHWEPYPYSYSSTPFIVCYISGKLLVFSRGEFTFTLGPLGLQESLHLW